MMNETEKAIRALEMLKERRVVPVSEEKMNEFLEMAIKALSDNHKDRKKAKRFKRKYLKLKSAISKIQAEIKDMPTISSNKNDVYKADIFKIIDTRLKEYEGSDAE